MLLFVGGSAKWFEMAPHEVGFTDLGLFINTSHLGSKIHEAHPEDEGPEMDMTKLLGVHASCFLLEIQHLKKKRRSIHSQLCGSLGRP